MLSTLPMQAVILSVAIALSAAAPALAESTVPVDGMVGQVNGQAIYASAVFAERHDQLKALGRSSHPVTFEMRARELLHGRLVEIVTDKLLLTEAERDMTEQDEKRLDFFLTKTLEELVRKLGEGSRVLAQEEALNIYQKPLEGVLEDERSKILIRRYMTAKLMPQIVIRRKDIDRFYRDNYEMYNTKASRIVRIISVDPSKETGTISNIVAEIEKLLVGGTPFAEVAGDGSLNYLRPNDGGLWNGHGKIEGDDALGEKWGKVLVTLKEGEYARIPGENTWLFVERISPGENRTLREAQLEIERILRDDQFRELNNEFRDESFRKGKYTDINEMTETLVKVAVVRYYKPETDEAKAFAGEK